jgi:DNA polymerase III epsilon subunit
MPSGAEAVHGLSDVFLSDKPLFADTCEALLDFIGDAPLIAHNAAFDFGFLNNELTLCGRQLVCMTRMICTVELAKKRHPGAKHSLDALCTRYGVDRSLRVKHGALIDAQLLAQCYVDRRPADRLHARHGRAAGEAFGRPHHRNAGFHARPAAAPFRAQPRRARTACRVCGHAHRSYMGPAGGRPLTAA